MGACCSSQSRSDTPLTGRGSSPHDSVQSTSNQGEKEQLKQPKQKQGKSKDDKQQGQGKKRRMPQIDMSTGKVIPEFGVYGVFDVLYELGSGGSGQTYLCRDMASGKVVAVKFVPRPLSKDAIPFMMAEVEIQAQLGEGCLHLITMHEIILTKSHLALVLEYASGGSLTDQVSVLWESALQRGGLFMEEQEASYYLRQFVQATNYCHKHRVAHRDLKLDNTLLQDCIVGPPRVKICDFGFAHKWTGSKDTMHDAIGTPVYMSPQMLAARQCASGYSGIKADMWAVGILLFVMLLGSFPFDHDSHDDPNSREAANEVWIKQQQQGWRKNPRAAEVLARKVLSEECCDLLDKLLTVDEEKRVTSDEILEHPWLHIPLTPEQEAAWNALQHEQAELDRQLKQQGNPRVAKLRREAMFAMMAMAAKPPSKTLFSMTTATSGSLHSISSNSDDFAATSTATGPTAKPKAATTADVPAMEIDDAVVVRGDAAHMSFMAGEGMQASLEQKVEAYRQQQASAKQARGVMVPVDEDESRPTYDQQQQQEQANSGVINGNSESSGRNNSSSGVGTPASGRRLAAPAADEQASDGSTAVVSAVSHVTSENTSNSKSVKSPFATSGAAARNNSSLDSADSESADDDDTPDEVWRLPMSSTVDPSVFKLTPELSVAAGALIRQLQKIGEKIAGRSRSARSSCPMY